MCLATCLGSRLNSKIEYLKICFRSNPSGDSLVTVLYTMTGFSVPEEIGKITGYDRIEKTAVKKQNPKRKVQADVKLPFFRPALNVLAVCGGARDEKDIHQRAVHLL